MIKLLNILKETQSKFRIDKSSIHGDGLFTNADIPLSTKVLAIGDVTRDPKHILTSYGKKINHSPNPNIEIKIIDDVAYIYSIKPIKANDELVADYTKLPEQFDRSTKFLNELEINSPNKIKAYLSDDGEISIFNKHFLDGDKYYHNEYPGFWVCGFLGQAASTTQGWKDIFSKYNFFKTKDDKILISKDNVKIISKNINELEINNPTITKEKLEKLIDDLIEINHPKWGEIRKTIKLHYPVNIYGFDMWIKQASQKDINNMYRDIWKIIKQK